MIDEVRIVYVLLPLELHALIYPLPPPPKKKKTCIIAHFPPFLLQYLIIF